MSTNNSILDVERKGEFSRLISTQEMPNYVAISFTDTPEIIPETRVFPKAAEQLLLQIGNDQSGYACAYLSVHEVESLILALQQARAIWYSKL